ncbi:MAG: hypothetical protein EOO34_00395 [Cyanobacteriota bacterium]|nr:MAG: hypothetical protein EOO34_00395 [Cyanobacteriota bacterium]
MTFAYLTSLTNRRFVGDVTIAMIEVLTFDWAYKCQSKNTFLLPDKLTDKLKICYPKKHFLVC